MDWWEPVSSSTQCTVCSGDMRRCNGMCNGSFSMGYRMRTPKEYADIKEKQRLEHEEVVLAEAARIKQSRGVE